MRLNGNEFSYEASSYFPRYGVRLWDSADLNGTAAAFTVHITRRAVTPLDAGMLRFVGREFIGAWRPLVQLRWRYSKR
jgi:hypothetical protein